MHYGNLARIKYIRKIYWYSRIYNVFRHDRGRGGGACIYVRDDLEVKQIKTNVIREVGSDIEDVWITEVSQTPVFHCWIRLSTPKSTCPLL